MPNFKSADMSACTSAAAQLMPPLLQLQPLGLLPLQLLQPVRYPDHPKTNDSPDDCGRNLLDRGSTCSCSRQRKNHVSRRCANGNDSSWIRNSAGCGKSCT